LAGWMAGCLEASWDKTGVAKMAGWRAVSSVYLMVGSRVSCLALMTLCATVGSTVGSMGMSLAGLMAGLMVLSSVDLLAG